jgi:hypothetical protein
MIFCKGERCAAMHHDHLVYVAHAHLGPSKSFTNILPKGIIQAVPPGRLVAARRFRRPLVP